MASSTGFPASTGRSITSSGWIALVRPGCNGCATAGMAASASKAKSRRRSTEGALDAQATLVEVGPQPARGGVDIDPPPLGIILKLVLTDARYAEIAAFRVCEVKARH